MNKKIIFIFLAILSLTFSAKAELHIDVTEGTFKPVPIAITPFGAGSRDPQLAKIGQEITQVVVNDLQGCGLFKVVDPAAYIQSAQAVMTQPRFADWKVLNAEALVGGLLQKNGANFQVDFRLFDVFTESQLTGLSFGSEPANWRRVAHKIADEIYERITGDKGYFDTRIVYVAVNSPDTLKVKYRLAIMDHDGENHQYLSSGNADIGTPRFSPDRTKIAYVDYGRHKKDIPNLRIYHLNSGQSTSLGSVGGQRMSPRFSPNGDHLILSTAKGAATSLYKMDLGTKKLESLTTPTTAIDVAPCYNPEGTKIVYCSDRGGQPQIYIKDAGAGTGDRVSFGQGSYYTPVWSPRGDLIAFTRQNGNTFYIGVMRPDGSGERMIDSGYLVEGPTWAPNGREILYVCQETSGSKKGLCSIDIVGFNKRKLNIPDQAHEVTWSS